MASNYQKGRSFEYRVKRLFENKGCIVLRSAGSHGLFDVVVHRGNKVIFIQLKVGNGNIKKDLEKIKGVWQLEKHMKGQGIIFSLIHKKQDGTVVVYKFNYVAEIKTFRNMGGAVSWLLNG